VKAKGPVLPPKPAWQTPVNSATGSARLTFMEIRLTPEKEARLHELAARSGKNTAELVQEAVDRLLDYETWFIKEVEKGQAQASSGELIEHDAVVARIEKRLKEKQTRR
jgi:predicted transcriptional regulator